MIKQIGLPHSKVLGVKSEADVTTLTCQRPTLGVFRCTAGSGLRLLVISTCQYADLKSESYSLLEFDLI